MLLVCKNNFRWGPSYGAAACDFFGHFVVTTASKGQTVGMLAWNGRQQEGMGIAFGVHCLRLDRQMPKLLVNAKNVPLKYKIKHCSSDFNTRISASIDSEGLLLGCSPARGNRLFLRHLLPDDVQLLTGCSQIKFSFDEARNVHKRFTVWVNAFNAGIENAQPIEPVRCWDMARLCVVSRTPRLFLTFVLMQSSGYEMPCIPSCATLRMYSISVSKTKTVSTAQTIIATNRGCEVRFLADSLQRASNASPYVTVTDNDTPQCSYCFPEISRIMGIMGVVPMTVMAKSQITAIGGFRWGLRLMLPRLLEHVRIGWFRAPNCSTQITHRRKLSSSAPYGCKMALGTSTQLNMLRERRVYSETKEFFFGLSAPWPTPCLFF